jgi:hypothetical protein
MSMRVLIAPAQARSPPVVFPAFDFGSDLYQPRINLSGEHAPLQRCVPISLS